MSKFIAMNQIEQQIEALPPLEQVMMLERIVRHLKRLLVAQPIKCLPCTKNEGITEKLNQVYKVEGSSMDTQLTNAQFVSIGRDEW